MQDVLTVIGGIVAVGAGLFFIPMLGALAGGVSGWIVGIFFGDAILGVLAAAGIKGIGMWQLGVTLGFIGGFFSSSPSNTNS